MKIFLNVPYEQKDQARRLGARWDAAHKKWYLQDVEDLTPFIQWMPDHLTKAHEPSKHAGKRA